MATLALTAANAGIRPLEYRLWARQQIHYMLGDAGRSYLIGFGENYPRRPHHASSSCYPLPADCTWSAFTSTDPNPIILYGALVGGPSFDDSFSDSRDDYYQNEVTCDYNAGFQSAVAGLLQLEMREKKLLTSPPATRQEAVQETVQHLPNPPRSPAPGSSNGNYRNTTPKTVTAKRFPPASTVDRLLSSMLQNRPQPQPRDRGPKIFKRQGVSRETGQNERGIHQISQQFVNSDSFNPSKRHDPPRHVSAKHERDGDPMMPHWQAYRNSILPPSQGHGGLQSSSHHVQGQGWLKEGKLSTPKISNKVTLIKHTNKNVQQINPFFVQKEKSNLRLAESS